MNPVFFIYHNAMDKYRKSGGYEGTHIDKIYLEEIKELLHESHNNIFKIFYELTYMYVRNRYTNLNYYDIPLIVECPPDNPTLFVINHLRSALAFNIIDFYESLLEESIIHVTQTLREKSVSKSSILNILRTYKPTITPPEKLVDLSVSICEFSEYISYLKQKIDLNKITDESLEFIISCSLYFGYINRSETGKWEECSSYLIKIFNIYTSDANREEGCTHYNGYFIYDIFRRNQSFPARCLKDVNIWVLRGYVFKLEEMGKEYDDIWEGIEREEYSEEILLKCDENKQVAWKIYKGLVCLNWKVNSMNVKFAERVIFVYENAINQIRAFKDITV